MSVQAAGVTGAAVQPRPVDRVTAAYLLISALALLFPHRPPMWWLYALVHLGGAALLLGFGPLGSLRARVRRRFPRAAAFIAGWYPLIAMPAMYSELAMLNVAVHDGRYFDPLVIAWEQAIFGGQPSRDMAQAFASLPLSEALHGAYLSYYLIIFGPPLALWAMHRRAGFELAVFSVMITFYVHYLFFIYFPVQGPRYLLAPPVAGPAQGSVYALTHEILQAGSSRGAAFPSSHVGVSVAQTIAAIRVLPAAAPVLGVLTIGLALGAVYGGFHYATDAVAGAALGLALAWMAPGLMRRLVSRDLD